MDIKCPKFDHKSVNSFGFQSDNCPTPSFESSSLNSKRNAAEILDYKEVMTSSYPRKRHNYGYPTKSTVSYYPPKDTPDNRCVGVSHPGSLISNEAPSWAGPSSNKVSLTQAQNSGVGPGWKPWRLPPVKSCRNIGPSRRKSSSSKPTYIRPSIKLGVSAKFIPDQRSRSASGATLSSSNFTKDNSKEFVSHPRQGSSKHDSDEEQWRHQKKNSSLSELVGPQQCCEIVGQPSISLPSSKVRKEIESAQFSNCIIWGPPGCGKSCLGSILAKRCSARGCGWRYKSVSGALLSPDMLSQILGSNKSLKRTRLLLFVDDLHCTSLHVQNLLASSLDDDDVVLIATSLHEPRSSFSPAIISRCDLLELHALQANHLETILRRALRRLRILIINQEADKDKSDPNVGESILKNSFTTNTASNIISEDRLINPAKKPKLEYNLSEKNDCGNKLTPAQKSVSSSGLTGSENAKKIVPKLEGSVCVEAKLPVTAQLPKSRSSAINDNGIEDMSDDEDESILDVLTKDLDKISDEFKIEHDGECSSKEGDKLLPNDLDCVSDDEFFDNGNARHVSTLESIDSSEDEAGDVTHASNCQAIGITRDAMTLLCEQVRGDGRVLLRVLQQLMREACAGAGPGEHLKPTSSVRKMTRKNVSDPPSSRMPLSKEVHRDEKRKSTDSGALRIANYGSNDSQNERVVTYIKDELNTDDISSDEDAEGGRQRRPFSGDVKDDLDNVSDVSDGSVNLSRNYDELNTAGKTIIENNSKPEDLIGSDDVLSDALSSDDILDYDEIDEESSLNRATEKSKFVAEGREHENITSMSQGSTAAFSQGQLSDSTHMLRNKGRTEIMGKSGPQDRKCPADSFVDGDLMKDKGFKEASTKGQNKVMAVIDVQLVRMAFQTGSDQGARAAVQQSISAGDETAALRSVAAFLQHDSAAAAARLLLETAISSIGVGDHSAVSTALAALQAVPLVAPQHARDLIANTAVCLARASKDRSAIEGLAEAEEALRRGVLPAGGAPPETRSDARVQ